MAAAMMVLMAINRMNPTAPALMVFSTYGANVSFQTGARLRADIHNSMIPNSIPRFEQISSHRGIRSGLYPDWISAMARHRASRRPAISAGEAAVISSWLSVPWIWPAFANRAAHLACQ